MARLSKKKLESVILKRIQDRFLAGVTAVKSKRSAQRFFSELLGPEEQVMLAKRLAAIYMLSEGVSTYRINKTLGLSTATILTMRSRLESGSYDYILSQYRDKKMHDAAWDDILALLRLGMPPMGRGRWKWLYDLEARHRTK